MIKLSKNSFGDTIVEVLIAITVLSMVLGSAYVLANRSLARVREAQEHSEALKLAEAQLEQLKQLADNSGQDVNGDSIFDASTNNFCTTYITSPDPGYDIVPNSNAACRANSGVEYRISTRHTSSGRTHTYLVNVTWDSLGGGSGNKVSLAYNLDQ